jgi:kojibiose phosphorylase
MVPMEWRETILTDDDGWLITVSGFDPLRERGAESLLTVANGLIGTRGSLEEGHRASLPATFVAGVFDPIRSVPDPPETLDDSPALVIVPNWLSLSLMVDGEALSLEAGEVLEHTRVLDMRQGLVVRRWRHRQPSGGITRLMALRCALMSHRHAVIQRAWIIVEAAARLKLTAALQNPSLGALAPVGGARAEQPGLCLRTMRSHISVAVAQSCQLSVNEHRIPGARETSPARVSERWEWPAEVGRTYVFDRVVTFATSRRGADPCVTVVAPPRPAREASALLEGHREDWAERWRHAGVDIAGDPTTQRALRLGGYHLIAAANPEDDGVSIGARALTGPAYLGHVFWDTEIYMLPFFVFTWPAAARALLLYRYRTLDAARAKAAHLGYRGALYPWESAAGYEATPLALRRPHLAQAYGIVGRAFFDGMGGRKDGAAGRGEPIVNGLYAHHSASAVAFGVWQYWQATADDEFFRTAGAEILLETARFWASRAQLEPDARYHIRDVIGPDEYHERVDDSAYTNWMARWNLEAGRAAAAWLARSDATHWGTLRKRLELTEDELAAWDVVAEGLADGYDPATGLIEQFAGYFTLEDLDLPAWEPRAAAMQTVLGRERVGRTRIIKQADIVLLCYLLWDRLRGVAAKNLAYYEPRCDHASSLSPGIHALVAARLGRLDLARAYVDRAAAIDLEDTMGNAAQGVHVGAGGGLWQAVVFGVAGMRLLDDGLAFDPHLLPGWDGLRFPVEWRGRRLEIAVQSEPAHMRFRLASGPGPMTVQAGRAQRTLAPGDDWVVDVVPERVEGGTHGIERERRASAA